MPSIDDIRVDEHSPCCYVLFIEGLPYCWTTDDSGELHGSGASSWIGASEASAGSREVVGARTMLPGLMMPRTLRTSWNDVKLGEMQRNDVSFNIADPDGTLAALFAAEGKDYQILEQRVAAGIADLTSIYTVEGDALAIAAEDLYIGIERIGPGGERRFFPALPFNLVGYEHSANALNVDLPEIPVSDEPVVHAGRMVTVYRIFKDLDAGTNTYADWPEWIDQHNAGNLVWWGTLRDMGRVYADGTWEIRCSGPESLLKRQLGVNTNDEYDVLPLFEIGGGNQNAYVWYWQRATGVSQFEQHYSGEQATLTGETRLEIISELQTMITNSRDDTTGTTIDRTSGEVLSAESGDYSAMWGEMDDSANVRVSIEPFSLGYGREGAMEITLHRSVWALIGYDVDAQHDPNGMGGFAIRFTEVTPENFIIHNSNAVGYCGEGYFRGRFYTAIDFAEYSWPESVYQPLYSDGSVLLDPQGDQEVLIGFDPVYIEPQNLVAESALATTDSTANDSAGVLVFYGKRRMTLEDDPEDFVQVALCSWRESAARGDIVQHATLGQRSIFIERWLHPSLFGFEDDPMPLTGVGWAVPAAGASIKCRVLNTWTLDTPNRCTWANANWATLMLSTGTGTGWDDTSDANPPPDLDYGDNNPTEGSRDLGGDIEIADLGLGIPYQLVDNLESVRDAFEDLRGRSVINRVRYAYAGSFDSYDMLKSLMQPRALCWRLHGGVYGVTTPLRPDFNQIDVVITEDDLAGAPGDPRSVIPKQEQRITAPIDKVEISYAYNPLERKTQKTDTHRSRDQEAKIRASDNTLQVTDHGLPNPSWFSVESLQHIFTNDWRQFWEQTFTGRVARHWARRHFPIRLTLKRSVGQDVRLGTRVLLSNPWPTNADGSRGLTSVYGIVTEASVNTKAHTTEVEIMIFAGQVNVAPHWAPIAKIIDITGAVLTCEADFMGSGIDGHSDVTAFEIPSWFVGTGDAVVQIVERSGDTWSVVCTGTVSSVDSGANTITLTGSPSPAPLRDTDKYVVMAALSDQTANTWPTELLSVHTENQVGHNGTGTSRRLLD